MSFWGIKTPKHQKPAKGGSRAQDIAFQSSRGKSQASEPYEDEDRSPKLLQRFVANRERPKVKRGESTTYDEDYVFQEEHEERRKIPLTQAISEAIRPALELEYENPYEHPEGREDKSIPRVLREARLLAERYEKLVDRVNDAKDLNDSIPRSMEADKLHDELQRSKRKCRDLERALTQQALDHSLDMDKVLSDHKNEILKERSRHADVLQDQKENFDMYMEVERKKGLGWHNMYQRLEQEQLPQLKTENSQLRSQNWHLDKDKKEVQTDLEILRGQYWELDEQHKVLQAKQKGHDARLKEIQQDHEVAVDQTRKKYKMELEQLERRIERMNGSHVAETQKIRGEHSAKIRSLEEKHDADMARLRAEQSSRIDRLKGDWNEKTNQYEEEKKQLKEDFETREANTQRIHAAARKTWEAEKLKLKEDFELREAELQSIHDHDMQEVKAQKQQLKEDFDSQKRQLREDFAARKAELDSVHADAMKQVEAERSQMAMELKALETRLNKAHIQETDRLKREIQSRNKAFVSRDTFVPVTDGALKTAFFDIVREVDTLSRLKWAFNNSPWTDDFQAQITDNLKRLQKHILQDTIWGVLFEFIFCSPFRVFGTEGKSLETQWNEACGKHRGSKNEFYTWPEANFGAEKWRYETMRSCQETLNTTTSAYDPRTKLREAYSKSLDGIQEKIEAPLKMVSELDQGTAKSIRGLIEKAARTWILFGTQRCRLLIVMQDLKTETESKGGKGAQTESVELVLRPELRRIGDSDGGSLDKEQVVAGCEGEAKSIMYGGS